MLLLPFKSLVNGDIIIYRLVAVLMLCMYVLHCLFAVFCLLYETLSFATVCVWLNGFFANIEIFALFLPFYVTLFHSLFASVYYCYIYLFFYCWYRRRRKRALSHFFSLKILYHLQTHTFVYVFLVLYLYA